jgi:HAE1 family hydrophobic/amphiphilic exporter-1
MYKFFIGRPVTSWMFMLSFILLGLYSLRNIPIDRLPDVDFPTVSIVTTYPGANPSVVDVNVTRVIEDQISTISGIEAITSQSFSGTSRITISFSLEKDIDVAAQEVRDAVQRAMRRLPEGVDPPVVRKVDTSLAPILAILLHSKTADYQTLAYWADKVIKRDFERIDGVGQVDLGGFRDNVMWVRIDPQKLYSRNLSIQEVIEAIAKNHLEAPAGAIYGKEREYIIRFYGKAKDAKELEEVAITPNLKLRDVGYAEFGEDEKRGMARFMGEQAVALIIYKQSKTNTVATADRIKQRMEEWNRQLPPGMRMDITFDSSVFVKDSVRAAIEEIIIGSLLTAVVVYFFLGSLRLTLVPIFAIPITLLGTVFFLYQTGAVFEHLYIACPCGGCRYSHRRRHSGVREHIQKEKGGGPVAYGVCGKRDPCGGLCPPCIHRLFGDRVHSHSVPEGSGGQTLWELCFNLDRSNSHLLLGSHKLYTYGSCPSGGQGRGGKPIYEGLRPL